MRTSIKLALPYYMVLISLLYIIIIAFINQQFIAKDVGNDLDIKISFLCIFVFSNITYIEKLFNNSEIYYLLPDKQKRIELAKRFLAKFVFVIALFILAYILCFSKKQNYIFMEESMKSLVINALFCALCSVFFWGNFTCYVVNKLSSAWIGMTVAVIGWFLLNSTWSKKIPIYIHIYSNTVTDKYGNMIVGWEYGKLFAFFAGLFFFVINIFGIYNSKYNRRREST